MLKLLKFLWIDDILIVNDIVEFNVEIIFNGRFDNSKIEVVVSCVLNVYYYDNVDDVY